MIPTLPAQHDLVAVVDGVTTRIPIVRYKTERGHGIELPIIRLGSGKPNTETYVRHDGVLIALLILQGDAPIDWHLEEHSDAKG